MATVSPAYDISLSAGEGSDQELPYNIYGAIDESDAFYSLVSNMLIVYQGKFPASARIERKAGGTYLGIVSYKAGEATQQQQNPLSDEPGGSTIQFEISTEAQHITQSLETISRTGTSGVAPATDHKRAINVTSEGVEGVDILVPTMSWAETHYFAARAIDRTYINTLKSIVGKMNAAPFRDFARGEVLFVGASGAFNRERSRWELTYKFLQSDNVTGLDIGNGITIPAKLGWDYVWVEYAAQADDTAKRLARRPYGGYCERVYQFGNYFGLRLNN